MAAAFAGAGPISGSGPEGDFSGRETFVANDAEKTLQEKIDAARPGTKLVIPAGTYDTPITITKSLMLKGEDKDKCIFEVTADKPAISIDAKGKGAVLIDGVTIKWQLQTSGRHKNPYALDIKDTKAKINNCIFRPLGNFQRSPGAVFVRGFSEMVLSNCDFEGFEYVVCYGEGTKGMMTDCFIRDCGHQGVILYRGATATVQRNIITGSRYHAVRTTGGKLIMKENLIIKNRNRGVYLGNKAGNGTITDNLLIENGVGVDGISACTFLVQNNVIMKSGSAAVTARPYAALTVQQNVLVDNPWGIVVSKKDGDVSPVRSKIGVNLFWNNKNDTENCESKGDIKVDPMFVKPDKGNFTVGHKKLRKMGLQKPKVLYELWCKYQKVMGKKK